MRFTRDYSSYPPKAKRISMIRDVFAAVGLLALIVSLVLDLCGFHTAAKLITYILGTVILTAFTVGVPILGIKSAIRAFRQKRIGAGIFLAFMSLTVPTVILLAATEKGRALVLYILEGY
ncbi:MAG: hypothetical protein K2N26_04475 [Oscillospiraceae bacterium]|nr:hypothetical protein [Oscillospiraceae bacterium]